MKLATPPGLEVTATVELIAVEGRKLIFAVEAHDGVDLISKGRHERFVINRERFTAKLERKNAGQQLGRDWLRRHSAVIHGLAR